MDRRTFLRVAAFAVAAGLLPADALAEEPETSRRYDLDARGFSKAWRAAVAAGRPILALVVPADPEHDVVLRGHAFGEAFNHGDDRLMAAIAACDVVCATMDVVRELAPQAGDGEPLALLIDPSVMPAPVRRIDPTLAPYPQWTYDEDGEHAPRDPDATIRSRVDTLGDALKDALLAETTVTRFAVANAAVLGEAGDDVVARLDAGGDVGDDELLAAAPLALAWAQRHHGPEGGAMMARLAKVGAARWREAPPIGARWADEYGCGVTIEGEDSPMYGCGMGSVPALASRFLTFASFGW